MDEYIKILSNEVWRRSPDMLDFERKETARIYQTENGYLIAIRKPRIETSFCFRYGYCGISTDEDEERAHSAMRRANTDESYFIEQNTKELTRTIERIKNAHFGVVTFSKYSDNENSRVRGFYAVDTWSDMERAESVQNPEYLTENDRAGLAEAHKIVLKDFEKRLQRYLKRYGLSKLHTWTYLSD